MAVAPANDNVEYRIGTFSGFLIVATAVFLDGIGFLLMLTGLGEIVTELIGICGSILFFVWFLFLGVSFMSGKATQKLGVIGVGTLIEVIPFINGISPTFTIETVSLIAISRKEDKEKATTFFRHLENNKFDVVLHETSKNKDPSIIVDITTSAMTNLK